MKATVRPPVPPRSSGAFKAGTPARDYAIMMCSRGTVRWFPLVRGNACTIGRGDANDIVIPDDAASRQHAVIHGDRTPEIEDLHSLNGTVVASRRLAPGERVRLEEGMAIQVGSVTLIVHFAAAESLTRDGSDVPGPLLHGIVLEDEKMRALLRLVEDVAPSDLSILILGETGTGKELLAQLIHERSPRMNAPFIRLNCAALPETLAESELFGHERGAFTGADRAKAGLFEAADGGTLFLDEIGELSAATQARLLRALDKGEVLRVGAVRPRKVKIRVVAATNRDLRARVQAGYFRADLFYRLSGVVAHVPPLRDRRSDIPALVERFAKPAANGTGKALPLFTADAMSALCAHDWPGNVRELKHVVERVVLVARGGFVTAADLQLEARQSSTPSTRDTDVSRNAREKDFADTEETPTCISIPKILSAPARNSKDTSERTERERIVDALARAHGNQVRAAKILGISRRTLINRLDEYGLPRPRKADAGGST